MNSVPSLKDSMDLSDSDEELMTSITNEAIPEAMSLDVLENELESLENEQDERRKELESYLYHLSGAGEETPIVNYPGNFSDLLEKIDAPIFWATEIMLEESTDPTMDPPSWMTGDPKMMEALRQMKKLDQQLAKKTIAAKKMKKGDNKEETYKSVLDSLEKVRLQLPRAS
ncbi:hypothetical protein PROFUN_02578 [Planoprotostelium fungivorum]|uniref:Uncharacterized protein n=1 Tax=Planoprotostelium fungivorum TaxID=1890364 RepID=A0A2P6MPC9_9EUKA|nr:hypothetical protein PROFUN_02578 [Planoprotostelium fungivorum]